MRWVTSRIYIVKPADMPAEKNNDKNFTDFLKLTLTLMEI